MLGPVDGLGQQIEKAENCESQQQIDDHHRGESFGLSEMQSGHEQIDELDADERHDQPAQPIDEEVPPQHGRGADGR